MRLSELDDDDPADEKDSIELDGDDIEAIETAWRAPNRQEQIAYYFGAALCNIANVWWNIEDGKAVFDATAAMTLAARIGVLIGQATSAEELINSIQNLRF